METPNDYEGLVSEGMSVREERDKIQWRLGDLANKVELELGKHMVKDYAIRIFVDKSSLLRYKDVARAFSEEVREEYRLLSWSHFRAAAAQIDAEQWLKRAADESWSVENLVTHIKMSKGIAVKPLIPVQLVECRTCRKWTLAGDPKEICENFKDCKNHV